MEAIEQVAISIEQLQLPEEMRMTDASTCTTTASWQPSPVSPVQRTLDLDLPSSSAQPADHHDVAVCTPAPSSAVGVSLLPLLPQLEVPSRTGKSKRSPYAAMILARESRIPTQALRLRHLPTIRKTSRTPSPLRLNATSAATKREPRAAMSSARALLA